MTRFDIVKLSLILFLIKIDYELSKLVEAGMREKIIDWHYVMHLWWTTTRKLYNKEFISCLDIAERYFDGPIKIKRIQKPINVKSKVDTSNFRNTGYKGKFWIYWLQI